MQTRLIVATLSLVASAPLAAQSPLPKTPPQLPSPGAPADTIIVSSFALANGAAFASAGQITMDHKLIGGKKPSQFSREQIRRFPRRQLDQLSDERSAPQREQLRDVYGQWHAEYARTFPGSCGQDDQP